jgi:hypothetical protein
LNNTPETLSEPIRALLTEIGIVEDFAADPLPGGANNRAFRLDAGGQSFLLKAYFRHPDDPRDRLGTEFAFSRFAWGCVSALFRSHSPLMLTMR